MIVQKMCWLICVRVQFPEALGEPMPPWNDNIPTQIGTLMPQTLEKHCPLPGSSSLQGGRRRLLHLLLRLGLRHLGLADLPVGLDLGHEIAELIEERL